jgi:predicted amidophosphoribosyltransferase
LQERGYNQADLLAHAFCRVTQLPLQVQGFKRIKTTTAQYSLSLSARQQNLQGAFQVEPALQAQRHRQVLLLDDIYTTGTTIQSAWEALTQQGFTVYGTVTVARTQMAPPRHSVKLKPLKRG